MESLVKDIQGNTLLYGKDNEEGIVGAYQLSDWSIRVFNRGKNGEMTSHDEPFYPYFFLSESSLLDGFAVQNGGKYWPVSLAGNNFYRSLAIFSGWRNYRSALDYIARNSQVREWDTMGSTGRTACCKHLQQRGRRYSVYDAEWENIFQGDDI